MNRSKADVSPEDVGTVVHTLCAIVQPGEMLCNIWTVHSVPFFARAYLCKKAPSLTGEAITIPWRKTCRTRMMQLIIKNSGVLRERKAL